MQMRSKGGFCKKQLEPLRPILDCSRFTKISITVGTLCFFIKKTPKCFILYQFLKKNSCFWHKKPFLFFWLKIGQNKYQILVLHTFQDPHAKICDGSIFFFVTLKIEIFSIKIPGREAQVFKIKENKITTQKSFTVAQQHDRTQWK